MGMAKDVSKQIKEIEEAFFDSLPDYIIGSMDAFGYRVINEIVHKQQEFSNLTGQTADSYSYGIYHEGVCVLVRHTINANQPVRNKLILGEAVVDFYDADGNFRDYFVANIDTDGGEGRVSAHKFLVDYKAKYQYAIIFTTGTEYSTYIENAMYHNVLLDAKYWSMENFLRSFKPITQ